MAGGGGGGDGRFEDDGDGIDRDMLGYVDPVLTLISLSLAYLSIGIQGGRTSSVGSLVIRSGEELVELLCDRSVSWSSRMRCLSEPELDVSSKQPSQEVR